jgi:hypothetical protein
MQKSITSCAARARELARAAHRAPREAHSGVVNADGLRGARGVVRGREAALDDGLGSHSTRRRRQQQRRHAERAEQRRSRLGLPAHPFGRHLWGHLCSARSRTLSLARSLARRRRRRRRALMSGSGRSAGNSSWVLRAGIVAAALGVASVCAYYVYRRFAEAEPEGSRLPPRRAAPRPAAAAADARAAPQQPRALRVPRRRRRRRLCPRPRRMLLPRPSPRQRPRPRPRLRNQRRTRRRPRRQ